MATRTVKILRGLSLLAAVFAFGLVMFGAFVRLSNAGLSCPDWPTCYGQVTWPQHAQAVARADAAFPERPYESHKAWREQVHRFLAGAPRRDGAGAGARGQLARPAARAWR